MEPKMRVVDLTLRYDASVRGFRKTESMKLDKDGWNASMLEIYSHAGTHMDAPFHFGISGTTIDRIPVAEFIGPAWVVDVRQVGAREQILPAHLGEITRRFRKGESLLFHTGWSRQAGSPGYRDRLPRISEELARWCAGSGVRMLGVEPPSVADVNNLEELTAIHRILLEAGIIIIEGLAHLDELSSPIVELIALPLKVGEGDGAPARVVAIDRGKTIENADEK